MATGPQAVLRFGSLPGMCPVATVDQYAKVLKQPKHGMWARSGQGGGRGAEQVQPFHLISLTLAMLCPGPIHTAPGFVEKCRSLVVEVPISRATPAEAHLPPDIVGVPRGVMHAGTTFGQFCDAFVVQMLDAAAAEEEANLGFFVRIHQNPLHAVVGRTSSPDDTHVHFYYDPDPQRTMSFSERDAVREEESRVRPFIERPAILHAGTFRALAEIYQDTLDNTALSALPLMPDRANADLTASSDISDLPNSRPENTTGAIPGRIAPVKDQPVYFPPAPLNSAENTHTRDFKSTLDSRAGQSQPLVKGKPSNAHRESYPFSAFAA